MSTKTDRQRIELKREAAAAKIREVAPHASVVLGLLDETKLDMLLIALGEGLVIVRED